MPLVTAMSTSWVTCSAFSSERCIEMAPAPGLDGVDSGGGDGRTASGCAACGLLILGGRRDPARGSFWTTTAPDIRRGFHNRVRGLDIAVKKGRELGLRQRPDARRLDIAVLEQHQRRNAADAELRRYLLVLVDVDLGDLQPPVVLLRHLVEDRCDRLARPAPFGPVVDQHRRVGLEDFGLESVVGNMAYVGTAHGSFQGGLAEP